MLRTIFGLLPIFILVQLEARVIADDEKATSGEFNKKVDQAMAVAREWSGVIRSDIGVTRRGTKIPCLITADDLNFNTKKTRILLVGQGTFPAPEKSSLAAMAWFSTSEEAKPFREKFALSAVPMVNVDGWATGKIGSNLSKGNPEKGYPPEGNAYNSPTDPEAAYLWRWIGMHAPDLVVVLAGGSTPMMFIPTRGGSELDPLRVLGASLTDMDDLASQLVRNKPSNTGTIPAVRVDASERLLQQRLKQIMQSGFSGPSPARKEIQMRLDRTPIEVATQLSKRYGHNLNSVAYIPALALIGRMRLGELTNDGSHLADVEKIVRPYLEGKKQSLPKKSSGSNLSGHLVFGELVRSTKKSGYLELAKSAADLGFDESGEMKTSMPFHNEMSDAVFMGCPILVQVGRLTGETKYFDMAVRHMQFMLRLNLRKDGLHRHSPLDETAWGRGNGFPALGLALCLSDLPKDHAGRAEMLEEFRDHIAALVKHQDPTGMLHQVVDRPESYRELSSTCMVTFSMIRGVRNGWLDENTYRPVIEKAWAAIKTRVASDGTLVDVCTGTGKQKSLRDYYDRTAILGPDPRGGAMALMVSTEMAMWESE